MTSIEAIIATLMPTLNISLSVAIALKAAIQNNIQSSAIVKLLSLGFIIILLMILKRMIL